MILTSHRVELIATESCWDSDQARDIVSVSSLWSRQKSAGVTALSDAAIYFGFSIGIRLALSLPSEAAAT